MYDRCIFTHVDDDGNSVSCEEMCDRHSEFCIFHRPGSDDKHAEFHDRLYDLFSNNNLINKNNEYVLTGYNFPRFSFDGWNFSHATSFNGCYFSSKTVFNLSTFSGSVAFRNCIFEGDVLFDRVTFNSILVMQGNTFQKDLDFNRVTFNRDVTLSGNTIHGLCSVNGCPELCGSLDMHNNSFNSTFSCTELTWRGTSRFTENSFRSGFDVSNSVFQEPVASLHNEFWGTVDFHKCRFRDTLLLKCNNFRMPVYCSGATFDKKLTIHDCRFREAAFCDSVMFADSFVVDDSVFNKSVNFKASRFESCFSFVNTYALDCISFESAHFGGPLDFSSSYYKYLFHVPLKNVCYDHSVIEDFYNSNTPVIENCTFRHAFLLSLNLHGLEIKGCDFSGAVFESVWTRDWRPDVKTVVNTRFIYTNYFHKNIFSERHDCYVPQCTPDKSSRVPHDGEFSKNEYAQYSLVHVVKKAAVFSCSIHVPLLIRSDIINYINYFTDFMRIVEGVALEIYFFYEGEKVRIDFKTEHAVDMDKVRKRLAGYIEMVLLESLEVLHLDISDAAEISGDELKMYETDVRSRLIYLRSELGKKLYTIHKKDLISVVSVLLRQLCS